MEKDFNYCLHRQELGIWNYAFNLRIVDTNQADSNFSPNC
jgi:hypothetical protein